ncbi:hypothetical protein [Methanoculleus receptaculi]|uniref:Uncharacterized protein n=1 Tax=Methanoculleus receptaculi TaxID=394967 RepID=A0AAX4FXC1_9EURY|nr:hypothetical protein [Methanoculleus receptaculi]WOX58512.1 hypothetical protein R6Y96_04575 [Methanoculleus receptaculi]
MAAEEEMTLYQLQEEGEIDRETLNQRLKRASRILVVSSLKTERRQVYGLCRILNRIKKAGMTAHLSPHGLLLKLSKVYAVKSREERVLTGVPEQV